MKYLDPMEILFVKLGALGDVINTLPLAVNIMRRMDANITWLVEPLSFPILEGHPAIDEIVLFDKMNWKTSLPEVLKQLRKKNYDITLDLQRILKSALFTLASKSYRKIGFDRQRCKESTWLFPFERIAPSDPGKHMAYQYLDFADYLGIKGAEITWEIPLSGLRPFELPEKYVVLNIGATKKANLWMPEYFSSLSSMVRDRFGMHSVITGGKEDVESSAAIERSSSESVINLAGKTSISDLKEVIAGAQAVVSCDTGPMHLAVALGRPVIGLFGPSDPRRTGPLHGRVLQKSLECVPCNKRRCDNPECMRQVMPDEVMQELESLWSA